MHPTKSDSSLEGWEALRERQGVPRGAEAQALSCGGADQLWSDPQFTSSPSFIV